MASKGKCKNCAKTVYPLEAVTCGPPAATQVFHKGCFKCQNEGCNWQLTLTSYKFYEGKIYCSNHNPMTGFSNPDHASGVRNTGDLDIKTGLAAPKLGTVNEQIRGAKKWDSNPLYLYCIQCIEKYTVYIDTKMIIHSEIIPIIM